MNARARAGISVGRAYPRCRDVPALHLQHLQRRVGLPRCRSTVDRRRTSRTVCAGHVEGPLGKVAIRTTIGANLTENADGSLHLVLRNVAALEAKGLMSWSAVVNEGHMLLSYDLLPTVDGWRSEAHFGVEMAAHEGSARDVCESMAKVESWLSRDLSALAGAKAAY